MACNEFRLVSPAIDKEGGVKLPRYYTDEGIGSKWNISPPLEWCNVPPKTKSLALVVQDVDIVDPTGGTMSIYPLGGGQYSATLTKLPEGLSGKEDEMGDEYDGIEEGLNDLKVNLWRGPKNPNYCDRFEFKLYALDDDMHFDNQVTKDKLLDAITGHVLGEAVMIATF